LTPIAAIAGPVDYARDVKPILAKHCYACHGAQKQKSGFRLDTATSALKGGDSGPAIVPGKSGESRLIQAVTGAEGVTRMPPREPRLTAQEIALLRAWIDAGARAPTNEVGDTIANAQSKHWSFQPIVRPKEPAVRNSTWVRNPIDRFVLARLEKEGVTPSPEADRITLIRRLSLDLLGLPPSLDEVNAFVADRRPDAYEHLVKNILESPHYGECWGRHWLDLARYADSNGFNIDAPRSIWKYRDWVINALNQDMPFDEFTIEQIAGDLLPHATVDQRVATGFHRNTLINEEGGIDLEQFRVESIVDRVNTTGAVFLGLTVGCAQCHDHKYDPIKQREFYQFFAFFNNADEPILEVPTARQVEQRQQVRAQIGKLMQPLKALDTVTAAKQSAWEKGLSHAQLAKLPSPIRAIIDIPEVQRSDAQKRTLAAAYRQGDYVRCLLGGLAHPLACVQAAYAQTLVARLDIEKKIDQLRQSEPVIVTSMVMAERKQPRETHVHLGGDFLRKGVRVLPDVPAVLPPLATPKERQGHANRLDLARWLVDPRNPLTPRVLVNRFWQHHFGIGLVETENDFGTQGSPPTHPELLNWLASEFLAGKGSMKEMHRLIVTSATYRQASRQRPELATLDPRNRLLARQSRVRLDAENVRDSALAASGLLSCKVGGPSVFPPQPEGVFRLTQVPREWNANIGSDRYRRGMYTFFWRSAPYPALTVFDAPESTTTCTRRNRSNTPLQALTLLNDQAFFELAQGLAARVLKEAQGDDGERLRYAFRVCLARNPSRLEQDRLSRLLTREMADMEKTPADALLLTPAKQPTTDARQLAAWTLVARVLLNLDEFITRE
jgi:hypothetical protein